MPGALPAGLPEAPGALLPALPASEREVVPQGFGELGFLVRSQAPDGAALHLGFVDGGDLLGQGDATLHEPALPGFEEDGRGSLLQPARGTGLGLRGFTAWS